MNGIASQNHSSGNSVIPLHMTVNIKKQLLTTDILVEHFSHALPESMIKNVIKTILTLGPANLALIVNRCNHNV